MTVSIPALIAEARSGNFEDRAWMIDIIESLADALESLSAPSGDDEREALALIGNATEDQKQEMILSVIFQRHYIQPIPGNVDDFSECVCGGWSEGAMEPGWDDHMAEVAIAAGFRRPSPVTREALIEVLADAHVDAQDMDATVESIAEAQADAVLSRFSLQEPAEDEWCREESCQYRDWRSGSMPTHKRGAGCPPPVPVKGAEQ